VTPSRFASSTIAWLTLCPLRDLSGRAPANWLDVNASICANSQFEIRGQFLADRETRAIVKLLDACGTFCADDDIDFLN
jgi:hypothetical protein